jgi:hypothetical protein
MVTQYSYLATDLQTNVVLGEIPVNNVSLNCQLNTPGNMQAGGHLDDPRIDNDQMLLVTEPGKTAFWAYRENAIVWGGVILSRQYNSEGKTLTITGQTFEAYAARRFPRSVIGTDVLTWNYLQCQTIDNLWKQLQSATRGSIGVLPMNLYPANDVAYPLTINGYDLSISYDDIIQTLVNVDGGPDYTIAWLEDGNGLPLKQLSCGLPLGQPVGATDLVIDYPGPVQSYLYNENASAGNNRWWATGDGDGALQAAGSADNHDSWDAGYPLWEGVNNYQGVTQQSTINAHAASDLKNFPIPLVTHNTDLKGDAFPEFGTYDMGDYVVVNVTDPRFQNSNIFNVRAVGWSIQPPDEGQGTEMVTLVYDEVDANS